MNIYLHSDDINLIEHWTKALSEKCIVVDTLDELFSLESQIIIVNYSACGNCTNIVKKLFSNKNNVLVLHRVPELSIAKEMLKIGAKGYGNAFMKMHYIASAIDAIKENLVWLHPEFTSMLIQEVPDSGNEVDKFVVLSKREKEVAHLLKEGKTYKEIAVDLDITPRTVKAHAKSCYEKLGVKDRLGLALYLK